MKKLLAMLLVVCFLVTPWICFAEGETHSQVIYTEVLNATSATTTLIPLTKIRPTVDKILGMEVIALSSSTVTAALWDSASATLTSATELINEFEATSYYAGGAFFPFPRYIVNGIVVTQDAQSRVIIYYIRQ